jgi:CRISPR/Cas system-associated protein Csm6
MGGVIPRRRWQHEPLRAVERPVEQFGELRPLRFPAELDTLLKRAATNKTATNKTATNA